MRSVSALMFLLLFAATGAAQDFKPPVRIQAGGEPIDTAVGHAAPFMYDFDGDGLQDLLVGQFGDGILKIYQNTGTSSSPEFAAGFEFKEGTGDGRVPTG